MSESARILVVDDEELLRKVLCETLQVEGHVAVGCRSGAEALECLRQPDSRFDLILTDMMMPGMDGITLLRQACQHDPLLVAVMMTGVGTIATAVEAMQVGALDYILKPFRLFEAMPVINRALAVRALRVRNRTLERQVREHAATLELKNQELEAFSYSVSHDLRAPLRRIEQFSQRLAGEHGHQFDPAARHLLDRICANTALMSDLIEDLLELSQVTQGPLAITEVDLSAEAQAIVDALLTQEPGRKIAVRIAPGLTWQADAGLAHIVLDNLIGNAWKYTSTTPDAAIEIGRAPSPPEAWYIRDNGVGFDMARADRLFKPFQRLHAQGEFAGTGIGLSLVARIIARHHGTIHAESAPGQGATFVITTDPASETSRATSPNAVAVDGLATAPPEH